jgi:ubiquinone/menaquinone biosynthesis C-methylase UbiE
MDQVVGMKVLHPGGFATTRKMTAACQIGPETRVLDVACGTGATAVYLAEKYGCQVVGVDISKGMVAQATARVKKKGLEHKVTIREADAQSLPFADNSFDVTLSQAMLVLVDDQKKVIREFLRVTRPGGRLAWTELSWMKPPSPEFMQTVSDAICAYCMQQAHTIHGWETLFLEEGVRQLETTPGYLQMSGIREMLADEGLLNTGRIMARYLTNSRIKQRMDTMKRFFREHADMFGYGIYLGQK